MTNSAGLPQAEKGVSAGFPAPRQPTLREIKAPTAVIWLYQWNSSTEASAPLKVAPFQGTKFTVSVYATSSSKPKSLYRNKLVQPSDRNEKLKTNPRLTEAYLGLKKKPWLYKSTGLLHLNMYHVLLQLLLPTTSLQAHLLLVQQKDSINYQIFSLLFLRPLEQKCYKNKTLVAPSNTSSNPS